MAIKMARELRAGNVFMIGQNPMVVHKKEESISGRNSTLVKIKSKNLLTGAGNESVYRADDKVEVIVPEKKECEYSYFADSMYVFMDEEYNQHYVEQDVMEDAIKYLEESIKCEVMFYNDKAIAVELPNTVLCTIE